MKNIINSLLIAVLFIINACSFANKSTITVPINSSPPGADVYVEGKNFGQTPAFVELTPDRNYKATISKEGYESVEIDMEAWYSLRGGSGADGKRCMMDVGSFILPYFIVLLFSPEKCGSFKQSDYFVDLGTKKKVNNINQNQQINNRQMNNNGYHQQGNPYQNNGYQYYQYQDGQYNNQY